MIPPIGLFDSGLGGLSVARAVLRRLPTAGLWVVGDTVHVPYGGRPLDEVRRFALALTEYLAEGGCCAVVMACNISSAVALERARARVAVPVFGMVEAGARAAALAGAGTEGFGVLATEGTVKSRAYENALSLLRPDARVHSVACPAFVPLVEGARWDSEEARSAAREYAAPLVAVGVRVVVLGCTHYPFLEAAIRAAFPYPVRLVDPAEAVADDLEAALGASPPQTAPEHRFEATADPASFARAGSRLLGRPFEAGLCPVWTGAPSHHLPPWRARAPRHDSGAISEGSASR